LLLLVCAPAAEEFFYRGFIYGQSKRIMPVSAAVFAQACVSAVMHFRGPGPTCVLLLYGLILGTGRARGAQFLSLAGAHLLLNVGWVMSVS
jgi:membrane protease YdiL (CAAX protease family)